MNLRNRLTLLLGGTSALLIASLALIFVCAGLVFVGFFISRSNTQEKRIPKRPVVYVDLDDAPVAPVAEATSATDQTEMSAAENAALVESQTPLESREAETPPLSVVSTEGAAPAVAGQTELAVSEAETSGAEAANVSANAPAATATPTQKSSQAAAGAVTATPTLTSTATGGSTPTATPTRTPTPSPTPGPGRITGKVLLNGAPANGVKLKLEDQAQNTVAEMTVAGDGIYNFPDLTASSQGYVLVFAQEWNPQFATDEVLSWGWLGPIAVEDGQVHQIPDFDIALQGFEQSNPQPNATFSAAAVSSDNPVTFEWGAYPGAGQYWVDLIRGEEQSVIWQSPPVQVTTVAFDGTVSNGSHVEAGEYWWGVGARRELGSYTLAVYGYLPVLMMEP